jgi:hypothetical protein
MLHNAIGFRGQSPIDEITTRRASGIDWQLITALQDTMSMYMDGINRELSDQDMSVDAAMRMATVIAETAGDLIAELSKVRGAA